MISPFNWEESWGEERLGCDSSPGLGWAGGSLGGYVQADDRRGRGKRRLLGCVLVETKFQALDFACLLYARLYCAE